MEQKELSELTDQELLDKAKKMKTASTMNALGIGIIIGVVIYGVANDNFGFLALIPLYFFYKIISNSKDNEELEKLLKERKLK